MTQTKKDLELIYNQGAFFVRFEGLRFDIIKLLKDNCFKFDKKNGWFTTNPHSALLLRDFADNKTKNTLNRLFISHQRWKGALLIPKGEKLLSFQPGAVRYALSRNRCYLGLAPGLGKTPIAALIAKHYNKKTIIICPPFLAINTRCEFERWNKSQSISILGPKNDWCDSDILIVPDSILNSVGVKELLFTKHFKLLIVDEAHRFKNLTSGRTQALLGYKNNYKNKYVKGVTDIPTMEKMIMLSGTPMPNRPMELFSIIKKLAPQYIDFKDKKAFGLKYCGGFYDGWGYDFTGCDVSQLKKLAANLVSKGVDDPNGFMLRLRKEVLGMTAPTIEIVVLGGPMPRELNSMCIRLLESYSPDDFVKKAIAQSRGVQEDELHLSTYRRLLGLHKAKICSEFIKSILEETDDSIVIFGVHIEAILELHKMLKKWNPITVLSSGMETRHKQVHEFQNDKTKRIFLGNIEKIGVGFTLTKANRVIFFEWSWVPGSNQQAIDRVHRIGLTHTLHVQYLALENSIDKTVLNSLDRKGKNIQHV